MNKTVTEQLPQYELMVREYERSANVTYHDDLKIAAVSRCGSFTTEFDAAHPDGTTFEILRQRVELYEQVSQRWTADGTTQQLGVKSIADDQVVNMEVDAVWAKDGGKKGKKGGKKGSDKGKTGKCKGSWSKEGWKEWQVRQQINRKERERQWA